MKIFSLLLLITLLVSCGQQKTDSTQTIPTDGPIQLHPENPHYFLYKGRTLALVTSAEHYGAVINLDFDYKKYLETLSSEGMNYTRIFTGSYFELPGESFNIQNNTLGPLPGRVITPWREIQGDKPGKLNYDLSEWNPDYFKRLKDFMVEANNRDIIVEVTLFSSVYNEKHWYLSPQNPENNINISHPVTYKEAHTPENGQLYGFQEKFVRKMVEELNSFDNFFFEIQNEPYIDNVVEVYNISDKEDRNAKGGDTKTKFASAKSLEWQAGIAEIIYDEESKLPKKHLIAQNYSNTVAPLPVVNDKISVVNFHYAWPEAVEWNYHFNKVVGFDESGFAGSQDLAYRRQAWQFMLSGGGLFNNLDYSFFVGMEDGKGKNNAPGGGSTELRKQLKILSEFLHSFKLEKMTPDKSSIINSPGLIHFALSDKQGNYAIFLKAIGTKQTYFTIAAPSGNFQVRFLNTFTGEYSDIMTLASKEGILKVEVDIPDSELAIRISSVD